MMVIQEQGLQQWPEVSFCCIVAEADIKLSEQCLDFTLCACELASYISFGAQLKI